MTAEGGGGHDFIDDGAEEREDDDVVPGLAGVGNHPTTGPATAIGPVDPVSLVAGPSPSGYVTDRTTNLPILRISRVHNNVCVKCYVHQRCMLILSGWQMPHRTEICSWAAAAVRDPPDATFASRAQAAEAHIMQLKHIRAAVVWPGRTWDSVIAEAAADP